MSLRSMIQTRHFQDLNGLADALSQAPVRQEIVRLDDLEITRDLRLLVRDQEHTLTPDALSDIVRTHAQVPEASGRSLRRAYRDSIRLVDEDESDFIGEEFDDEGLTFEFRESGRQVDARLTYESKIAEINHRLATLDKPVWIRRVDRQVIAVLSKSYAPLDHYDVVEALRKRGLNRLAWVSITRRSLDLAVYTELPTFDLGDDAYHTGVHIYNSETGDGRLSVRGYLFRDVCSNGSIFGVRHERWFVDSAHIGNRDALTLALDRSVSRALMHMETVGAAIAHIRNQRMSRRSWDHVRRDVEQTAGKIALRRLDVAVAQPTGPWSAYGIFNAVTALAREYAGERRRGLELLSGRLVERLANRTRKAMAPSCSSRPGKPASRCGIVGCALGWSI